MSERPNNSQNQWRPTSPGVTPDEFENVIEGPATLIHFWAPWNPYDKTFDANLQQLFAPYAKRFHLFSVNTDDTAFTTIVENNHVAALPTLLFFSNGKVRGRFHGVETPEALNAFLDEMAQSPRR